MGTLTADCPRLDTHCPHKLPTSCRLTSTPNCCACADNRVHSRNYAVYIDGVGFVQRGTRWQSYCWFCKEFWNNRLHATEPPLEASQTQIPSNPDQTAFLQRWFEYHQGYRIVRHADGTEDRIAVVGEPFRDVSPGFLPRTLEQLRNRVSNDASRPENRFGRDTASAEEQTEDTPQQSLEEALDSLLAGASDDDTEVAATQGAGEVAAADMPPSREATGLSRPLNRTEVHLQRARERLIRLFGTREDVQQDDYESPLSSMYNRAWDRYRQAEQRRETGEQVAPPSLDDLTPSERQEIEEQLLWGVLQESRRNIVEEHQMGNAGSYTPRDLSPIGDVPSISGITIPNFSSSSTDPSNTPPSTSAPPSASMTATSSSVFASASDSSPDLRTSLQQMTNRLSRLLEQHQMGNAGSYTPRDLSPIGDVPSISGITIPNFSSSSTDPSNTPPSTSVPPSASMTATSSSVFASASDSSPDLRTSLQQMTNRLSGLLITANAVVSAQEGLYPPEMSLDNQPDRPPALTDAEMTKNLSCQICYSQIADIAVLPCGHMVMCQWCADVVVPVKHSHTPQRVTKCPMCRRLVKQRFKIHMG
ncbi:hypothetical protein K505DRAFT_304147 [Melanomma pulvis-pyrius CBS 109.77]|uniref:RING-type domain-containing protein n=1 Tax=Melanomma pulvis-pyrius CBS 109.77 TaxID=1314802 RepID=A0A6A6XEQ7_9PLEO|nr:hypothetical protein K505DRAFT_304147 [Melanomma pulvis-pyrius CBS 109.77]